MKSLIILALTIASLNAFAVEKRKIGEDKKGVCAEQDQGKRAKKESSETPANDSQKKNAKNTISV